MSAAGEPLLVHDWLTGMRGGELVLEELLRMLPDASIATLFHLPGSVSAEIEERSIQTSPLQWFPGIRGHYRYYLPLFPWAVGRLDARGRELVISISHSVAKSVRTDRGAYHLCYCNSPMRYVWDQRRVYFPDTRGPLNRVRESVLDRLKAWDAATADRVDLFVANSGFVADRIARAYGLSSLVVHPPVATEDLKNRGPEPDAGYLVTVSALVPYKRLEVAIEAAVASSRPLRIIGDGPERGRLTRLALRRSQESGVEIRVEGRIDRREVVRMLRRATVFLQPGVEDFGISSVEALAAGLPVVARGRGGVCDIVRPEIDGVLIDTEEPEGWAAAIDTAAQMRSNYLDRVARAEEFSPARFRTRIEDILRHRPKSASL